MRQPASPTAPCPHCGSGCVHRHGQFPLKDGTRHQRFLCRTCGRTFHPLTCTPLYYIKKRDRWDQLARGMVQGLSVRRMAAALRIQVATAFRWRHRLLSALCRQPQPVLTGSVAACEAYVPYSEKGSRQTDGPGAHGIRQTHGSGAHGSRRVPGIRRIPGKRPFRRFIDGKPSCVLLASAGEHQVLAIVSRGRPTPDELQSCLARVLGDGVELRAHELAPYAEACRRLGVRHRDTWDRGTVYPFTHPCRAADRLRVYLCSWIRQFHGVATTYLDNYLAWYRVVGRSAGQRPDEAVYKMFIETSALRPPGRVA